MRFVKILLSFFFFSNIEKCCSAHRSVKEYIELSTKCQFLIHVEFINIYFTKLFNSLDVSIFEIPRDGNNYLSKFKKNSKLILIFSSISLGGYHFMLESWNTYNR